MKKEKISLPFEFEIFSHQDIPLHDVPWFLQRYDIQADKIDINFIGATIRGLSVSDLRLGSNNWMFKFRVEKSNG